MPDHNDTSRIYPLVAHQQPMNIYSYSSKDFINPSGRPKRRQVKNACTNCQRACKKCDDARPCLRCVKYGVSEECVDSQRKERKKGVKRGPYKKRDGRAYRIADRTVSTIEAQVPGPPQVQSSATPPQLPQYLPIGYPAYYPAYPPPGTEKPLDPNILYTGPSLLPGHPYYQGPIYHHPAPYMIPGRASEVPYPMYTTPQRQPPHEMLPNAAH
ncbi:hypothetical protein DFP72DRAFT_869657 [Ephemerocybe angulata]|uniref:Transcription activator of gluconeogenesis ERT1 n=1 Tax=Ephemerocybe angulata TaxID=980116 RepID=A0A8H6MH96_9AGAR|nr:hypothetical protein DFP72DRAFT_869657 [Tulosesus angulatus]